MHKNIKLKIFKRALESNSIYHTKDPAIAATLHLSIGTPHKIFSHRPTPCYRRCWTPTCSQGPTAHTAHLPSVSIVRLQHYRKGHLIRPVCGSTRTWVSTAQGAPTELRSMFPRNSLAERSMTQEKDSRRQALSQKRIFTGGDSVPSCRVLGRGSLAVTMANS